MIRSPAGRSSNVTALCRIVPQNGTGNRVRGTLSRARNIERRSGSVLARPLHLTGSEEGLS
jgi:hypothetical protein